MVKQGKKSDMRNRNVTFTAILFGLSWFVLPPTPKSFGVVPPPDGGYPGGNTAEGASALASLSTGTFNTAVGFLSLRSNTNGRFNTAIGAGALLANVGNPGTFEGVANTATGAGALLSNTTGEENTGNGTFALFTNTEGTGNTATGVSALFSNTTGGSNTASGVNAMFSNSTGSSNTATGAFALNDNATGNFNTAIGIQALLSNASGGNNTAIGGNALFTNTDGHDNTAAGLQALSSNTTGNANTAVGRNALVSNITGNGNIALGISAGSDVTDASHVICIGHVGANVDNSCFIGNVRDAQIGNDAIPVMIDSFGKLGTTVSSRRFKKEIQPMAKASEAILALKPVTFHYKTDNAHTPQFGLIAEEVAEVNPNLVVRDKNGEIYSVRYDAVNAMLLNEFLKEHCKNEQQEEAITQLKSSAAREQAIAAQQQEKIKALAAQVKEQAAQIERVSAQVQLSQPSPQTVSE